MIHVHVASINRSGASLVTRLLDGHPDVASYPIEFNFPHDRRFFPFIDQLTGTPTGVPQFDPARDTDPLKFFGLSESRPETVYQWGKEKADPVGVRKNYLEREVYGTVKTDFDYDLFVRRLREGARTARTVRDLYEARHRAYFEAWDGGAHMGTMSFVATYGSGELFISDFDRFFSEIGGLILTPVRDVFGHVASEKTRYARRYYGSRRFPKFRLPDSFVKAFSRYDLEALTRSWLVAVTRTVILQEKYGLSGRQMIFRYETLVRDVERSMRALARHVGLRWDDALVKPTIGGHPWGGSSHRGKQDGVNAGLVGYYESILRPEEISLIRGLCGELIDALQAIDDVPADLRQIPKRALYDYERHKHYSEDPEKWALYCALAFRDRRRVPVGPPDASALAALAYAQGVRLAHMPRLWRQRLFPGWGKQNYT